MKVALYARLSVDTDVSVSIERQLAAGREYAERHGYEVVLEATDVGVSATKNAPEDRAGWQSIMTSTLPFEGVIIWKIDRLARSVNHFFNAHEALQKRSPKASLIACDGSIDMSTPSGELMATMLAAFARMEAQNTSARVAAAQLQMKKSGRHASGPAPYGYMSVENPDGPGKILVQNPDTIEFVKEAARRAQHGDSLYSIGKYLTESHAPRRPNKQRKYNSAWSDTSVESILRSPVLGGMTPHTPGRQKGTCDVPDVLRDEKGLPVFNESLAIMSTEEWFKMQVTMKLRKKPGQSTWTSNPHLLHGVIKCTCGKTLNRTGKKGSILRCINPDCSIHASIDRKKTEDYTLHLIDENLGHIHIVAESIDDAQQKQRLDEINRAINLTLSKIATEDDVTGLMEQLASLKEERKIIGKTPVSHWVESDKTISDCVHGSFDEQREAIMSTIKSITVLPSTQKWVYDTGRLVYDWDIKPSYIMRITD